jgi:hypothetical protein
MIRPAALPQASAAIGAPATITRKESAMSYYGQRVTVREIRESVPRAKRVRKLENNTFEITMPNGERRIRLHQTDILTFNGSGFTVNSNGYRTITMRDRLNKYLPDNWRVYSVKGVWYLSRTADGCGWGYNEVHPRIVFKDGFRSEDFETCLRMTERDEKEQIILKAKIAKFVDAKLRKGKVWPQPSYGDCWHCFFKGPSGTMGEMSGKDAEREHILGHIQEGYMHGSLIVNALCWSGMTDFAIGMCFHEKDDSRQSFRRLARQRIRRYLQFKLGLAY